MGILSRKTREPEFSHKTIIAVSKKGHCGVADIDGSRRNRKMSEYSKAVIKNTIAEIVPENDAITVEYNHGRGKFTLNARAYLSSMITAGDMKTYCDILHMGDNYEEALHVAETLRGYCADVSARLADNIEKSKATGRYAASLRATIARLQKFANCLADAFELEKVEKITVKAEKCSVYTRGSENGKEKIVIYDGFQFTRDGITFQIYKRCKNDWRVTVPALGVYVKSFSSKVEAIYNDWYLEIVKKYIAEQQSDVKELHKIFIDTLRAEDYEIPEIVEKSFSELCIEPETDSCPDRLPASAAGSADTVAENNAPKNDNATTPEKDIYSRKRKAIVLWLYATLRNRNRHPMYCMDTLSNKTREAEFYDKTISAADKKGYPSVSVLTYPEAIVWAACTRGSRTIRNTEYINTS